MEKYTTTLQRYALVVGTAFVLVGILGFIPGITTNFDDMTFAGKDSGAELLGLFQVSVLHNIVHLLLGFAGLAFARSWDGARTYLIGGGLIYLLLAIYGFITKQGSDANFVPVNVEDDVLHVVLGLAMLGGGLLLGRGRERPGARATAARV